MILTRICRRCGQEKHEDAFATRNGHAANICKPCDVARQQAYRRRFNQQARAKSSKPGPATPVALTPGAESWWLGLSRAELQAQAVREEPRMSASKVGQWKDTHGEPVSDPRRRERIT